MTDSNKTAIAILMGRSGSMATIQEAFTDEDRQSAGG